MNANVVLPSTTTEAHAHQAYNDHLKQLFIKHKLSGNNIQLTAELSSNAGAKGVEEYSNAGTGGKNPRNIHRALLRKMKSTSPLPEPYFVETPVHDEQTNTTKSAWIPVLLLHEMLFWMMSTNRLLLDMVSCCALPMGSGQQTSAYKFCALSFIPVALMICLGFHGDGVPFAKNKSVEVLSWNFVGLPSLERVLFAVIEKNFSCKCGCGGRCTLDPLLEVFNWSLECLLQNFFPTDRHDKKPWTPHDKRCGRHAKQGNRFGVFARLFQCRGDWAWYKQIFSFPGWASLQMCWKCGATQKNGAAPFDEFSSSNPPSGENRRALRRSQAWRWTCWPCSP